MMIELSPWISPKFTVNMKPPFQIQITFTALVKHIGFWP